MKLRRLARPLVASAVSAFAFTAAHAQTDVATATQLQNAINAGDTDIVLTANITGITTPINIGVGNGSSASPITINGGGFTLSGSSEIFFVQSGTVTISNAIMSGNAVGGNGGTGSFTGGGALGAGGAIFVGSTANVTASNITFVSNSATGGNGGGSGGNSGSGGGGMNGGTGGGADGDGGGGGGGNGGSGGFGQSGAGGGGGGLNSNGSDSSPPTGGNGGGPHGGLGGTFVNSGSSATGINSGGGGTGSMGQNGGNGTTNGGGGGGAGGGGGTGGTGGAYGGGGGGDSVGGPGGFGGGGGGGVFGGGTGGFGGGGGAGGSGGSGGVGAGNGGANASTGGGGAGLGGAIFVQDGGTLIISGGSNSTGDSVAGGTGANTGAAAGSDLFLQTGSTTTFAPGTGNTIEITGSIADDSATGLTGGSTYVPGTAAGAAIVIGSGSAPGGTVQLNNGNTYGGGTTITNGATLSVGNQYAVGFGHLAVNNGNLVFGTGTNNLNLTGYSQQSSGNTTLALIGSGQAATPQTLTINNAGGLASSVDLGGRLTINLSGFTNPPPTNTTDTFTLLTTTSGYDGTYANLTLTGAAGLHGTLDYAGDDVILDLTSGNVLSTLLATGLTPNQQAVLAPINRNITAGNTGAGFTAFLAALTPYSSTPSSFGPVLNELLPNKFNQFASTTAFNNASFETQAEDTYLAGQRTGPNGTFAAGSGQLDASQLVVNQPGVDPTLALIHSRLLAWNQPDTMSDVPSAMLGGVDMKDPKAMRCCCCEQNDNPWNVFVRGNVILAQDFSQGDIAHVDDNTESVVVGADYRVTPNLLVGLSAGYAHSDATLDTFNSSATVDSYSPGIYASYADHGWYANFQGRYSYNSYSEARSVDFLHQTANGSPNGNEGVVDLDGGYDFHSGAWTYGPLAGLQYTHLTLNSFNETGSLADLDVNQDQSDSLRSRLGFNLSYAFCTGIGCITPHLSASWQHEFMDQSRGITSQFDDFGGGSFVVRTPGDDDSDDSALIDLGVNAQVDKSISVFGDYMIQAGQDNYFGQSVQAGVKIGF
jgi:uncharacterized protein YhjY with autotransporter beta-barrel domain